MVGFHEGNSNGTQGISNGFYFFDNGASSDINVTIRTSSNATNLTGAGSLPADKWYEYKIEIQNVKLRYT